MKQSQLFPRALCLIAAGCLTAIHLAAQPTATGAMVSYNDGQRGAERTLRYHPDGDALVCVNGTNRFTRALYGGPTAWRVETSDRPVFALFLNRRECRNIRFVLCGDDWTIPLDSTDYCESRYADAQRCYLLRDRRFGLDGEMRLSVVASPDTEQAIWRFESVKVKGSRLSIRAIVSTITANNFSRMGDIGADKPGGFEAKEKIAEHEFKANGISYFTTSKLDILDKATPDVSAALYSKAAAAGQELAGRLRFFTPDPYLNPLGGALSIAADGDWDGTTWLHGCIGWRMPLAGWRAAYAGDVLGWGERAVSHFDAYAASQVTGVEPLKPHPTQDATMNMARAAKEWGTQMYSNGYICRNPERNDQMHHYDMNLNYIDELLWHFQYDADTAYIRKMWPVVQRHLAWEKRNFDPDGDHLYDAYCCIWASDALYYSGGAVTHSSAYNYRGHLLAARLAELLGEDATPYQEEATAILQAMNRRLWLPEQGTWAEYEDALGLKRRHESPAVWSIYTPIDCGACTPRQAWQATGWVARNIPHLPISAADQELCTISTSNWMPYAWSINNVAPAEVMHTALAFFEAGRADEGYQLLKANILDNMYYGLSPANFGQLSWLDAARGECYRDFGDVIGISARTLIQGLFGIVPDALHGQCIIRPGFPASWDSASIVTPYMTYKYLRRDGKNIYQVSQRFRQPLKIIVREHSGDGQWTDTTGSSEPEQTICTAASPPTPPTEDCAIKTPSHLKGEASPSLGLDEPDLSAPFLPQDIDRYLNAAVDDIFKNRYTAPRPPSTTLQIPLQGVGEWCHPQYTPAIDDSVFRTLIADDEVVLAGVRFRSPAGRRLAGSPRLRGHNVAYTSLWDTYPDSIVIPLSGKASSAWLLMAGSTNHMQSRIDNGLVAISYSDGTVDTLLLRNPDNWCPIEQDYYIDGKAFRAATPRPYRVCLGRSANGRPLVSRDLGQALAITGVYGREIPGGAAQLLHMALNPRKQLQALTLRTLSNDVVIGLMSLTLQNKKQTTRIQ